MVEPYELHDPPAVDEHMAKMTTVRHKVAQLFIVDWRAFRRWPRATELAAAAAARVAGLKPVVAFVLHQPLTPKDAARAMHDAPLGAVLGGGGAAPAPNRAECWRTQTSALHAEAVPPLLVGNDSVHGHANLHGAVLFPHHIGQGCANDAQLVEELARVAALESSACGINWVFSPCVAVPLDLRWGRTYECFGEDPALVGRLAAAEVRGLQRAGVPVAACVKHWIGDGATTFGTGTRDMALLFGSPSGVLDQGDARLSDAELRDVHMPPYVDALAAGALTVMVSYSSVRSCKVHASRHWLTDVLKTELGFRYAVVSDYEAVGQCAADFDTAAAACLNAGVDMVMTPGGITGGLPWREQIDRVVALVEKGRIPMERIDDAVRRVLRVKAALGLLRTDAQPVAHVGAAAAPGCDAHRALARRAVAASCVVLQNRDGLLPLQTGAPLVVAGRGAHDLGMQCGGWSMEWAGFRGNDATIGTTIWEAVRALNPRAQLLCERAARAPSSPARAGAVALVVVGEQPYVEAGGDVIDLTLDKSDCSVIEAMAAAGYSVVAVLISGRPLALPESTLAAASSLVAAWLPGTEGAGVVDVLVGSAAWSGRLSMAWPRRGCDGDIRSRRRGACLFGVGHGLALR